MSELKTISPQRAAALMREGAVLVDVRERDEHARERIPARAITRSAKSTAARSCAKAMTC